MKVLGFIYEHRVIKKILAYLDKLERCRYLRYLFEKLPFADNEQDYAVLLPMWLRAEDLPLKPGVTGV